MEVARIDGTIMHFPEGYIYAAGVDLVWEVCLDCNYLVHIKESLLNSFFE